MWLGISFKIMKTSSTSVWHNLILWSAGTINIAILLLLFGIWRTGDRALNFIGNIFTPQPIVHKVKNATAIAQKIQELQELTSTVQTMETIVPTSAERKLGDFPVATTRLIYVARGEIRAGVDLSKLTDKNIKIGNNSIEINLPAAEILDSKIDVKNSRVYDYNRGFLNLGPDVAPELQTLAQRQTLTEIVDTACKEGILTTANQRAKETIAQLLVSTNGYQKVKINTTMPTSCAMAQS